MLTPTLHTAPLSMVSMRSYAKGVTLSSKPAAQFTLFLSRYVVTASSDDVQSYELGGSLPQLQAGLPARSERC